MAAVDANALVEDDTEDSDTAADESVESERVRHHSAPQEIDRDSDGEDDPDRRGALLRVKRTAARTLKVQFALV